MYSVTPKRKRDARVKFATMDHSDIRGLTTAFHLFFAGLPRSKDGDHPENCVGSARGSHKIFEGSPHRSRASRFRFGMLLEVMAVGGSTPAMSDWAMMGISGLEGHVSADIPDKACELAGDRHADFVLIELASHGKASPAFGQSQLGLPGDVTDDLRLVFLAHLQDSADLCFEAIVPGRLDQDAPRMFVTAFGNAALAAARAAGVLRRDESEIGHHRSGMLEAREF